MKLLRFLFTSAAVLLTAVLSANAEPTVSGSYRWEIAQGGRSVGLCGFSICSKPFGGVGQDSVNFVGGINDGRLPGAFQKANGTAASFGNISITTSVEMNSLDNSTLSLVKQNISGSAQNSADYRIKIVGPPTGVKDDNGNSYKSFDQLLEEKGNPRYKATADVNIQSNTAGGTPPRQITTTSGFAEYSIDGIGSASIESTTLEVLGPEAFNSKDPVTIRAVASSSSRADATGGRPLSSPSLLAGTTTTISAPIENIGFEFDDGTFVTQQQLGVELVEADQEISAEELFKGSVRVQRGNTGPNFSYSNETWDFEEVTDSRVVSTSIAAEFKPFGGLVSLEEAAEIYEVDHFNWIQQIIHIPEQWEVYYDWEYYDEEGNLLPPLPSNRVLTPIVDPYPASGELGIFNIYEAQVSPIRKNDIAMADDQEIFYYDEPGNSPSQVDTVYNGVITADTDPAKQGSETLRIWDEPRAPENFYDFSLKDQFMMFRTDLVGVKANGDFKFTGAGFTWKSDLRFDPSGLVDGGTSVFLANGPLDPSLITGGGIFDIEVFGASSDTAAVPEPGSFLLIGIAAFGFGGYQFRRRRQNEAAA